MGATVNRENISSFIAVKSKRPRKKAEGGRARPRCQEQGEGKLQARFDEGPAETQFGCAPSVYSTTLQFRETTSSNITAFATDRFVCHDRPMRTLWLGTRGPILSPKELPS